jgi:hypothetical protein
MIYSLVVDLALCLEEFRFTLGTILGMRGSRLLVMILILKIIINDLDANL